MIFIDTKKSILTPRAYGKITFHLKELMDKKSINRNQLAGLANFRFEVADRYYNGNLERIDIDVLARICFVLDCRIEDIMTYEKPNEPQ